MKNKRLSLLIPKHQNKSAKEITEMYLTQTAKPLAKPLAKPPATPPELPAEKKPEGKSAIKQIALANPFARPEAENSKDETCFDLLGQLVQHSQKTSELRAAHQAKEDKVLLEFIAARQASKQPLKKLSNSEIIQDFKEEARSVDKRIALLAEENKALKEKLALAMLEEVDERLRREKPGDRFVESYSNRTAGSDPDPPLSDLLGEVDRLELLEENEKFTRKVEEYLLQVGAEQVEDLVVSLCQSISGDRKRFRKQEIENSRVLKLKKEVLYRLNRSIDKLTAKD